MKDLQPLFNQACVRLWVKAIPPHHHSNDRQMMVLITLNTHPYHLCHLTKILLMAWVPGVKISLPCYTALRLVFLFICFVYSYRIINILRMLNCSQSTLWIQWKVFRENTVYRTWYAVRATTWEFAWGCFLQSKQHRVNVHVMDTLIFFQGKRKRKHHHTHNAEKSNRNCVFVSVVFSKNLRYST